MKGWIQVTIRGGSSSAKPEVRYLRTSRIDQVYTRLKEGSTTVRMAGDAYGLNCDESVEQVLLMIAASTG